MGKKVLDAGCGSGRYTWAMQQLGGKVDSFDTSSEAIKKCKLINPKARIKNLMDISGEYDFILCFGVLHHNANPEIIFNKLVTLLNDGGMIHIMVYSNHGQKRYLKYREMFKNMDEKERIALCKKLGGDKNIHGWYDALNPEFNYSYTEQEIYKWFHINGLKNIRSINYSLNINMNGEL